MKKTSNAGKLFLIAVILAIVGAMLAPKKTPDEIKAAEREAQSARKQEARRISEQAAAETEIEPLREKFKQWALQSTAVTDIAISGKGTTTIFVKLKAEKYTSRDNVRLIAESLARAYAEQVGVSSVVCHVFLGKEEYAKGSYLR